MTRRSAGLILSLIHDEQVRLDVEIRHHERQRDMYAKRESLLIDAIEELAGHNETACQVLRNAVQMYHRKADKANDLRNSYGGSMTALADAESEVRMDLANAECRAMQTVKL